MSNRFTEPLIPVPGAKRLVSGELEIPGNPGISLIDHFAGQAMIGLLIRGTNDNSHTPEYIASRAYKYAEALCLEGEKYINKRG